MSTVTDTSILEMLASKICHDLISPIGAVNNGLEFIAEMGADAGDEAIDLIAYSAQQASAKLQAYRMAYGAGGADGGIKPEDVYKVVEAVVGADKKITQNWDPYGDLGYGDNRPDAFCKMLMCGILLAIECLPKGGEIAVRANGDGKTLIEACGTGAAPRERMQDALSGGALHGPQQTHPYVTGLLARAYGFEISIEAARQDCVQILIVLPSC